MKEKQGLIDDWNQEENRFDEYIHYKDKITDQIMWERDHVEHELFVLKETPPMERMNMLASDFKKQEYTYEARIKALELYIDMASCFYKTKPKWFQDSFYNHMLTQMHIKADCDHICDSHQNISARSMVPGPFRIGEPKSYGSH